MTNNLHSGAEYPRGDWERYGAVVLLDALGSKTNDMENSRAFLRKIEELKETVRHLKDLPANINEGKESQEIEPVSRKIKFRYFGDSILITFAAPANWFDDDGLLMLSVVVNIYFCQALGKGILFRGAMAIGKYLESDTISLGPAIIDAATWYDKSDMMGVITTPATSNFMDAVLKIGSGTSEYFRKIPNLGYVRHEVPLSKAYEKKPNNIMTYVLNWPEVVSSLMDLPENMDVLSWYYEQVKSLAVPFGAESKYDNTVSFIMESLKLAASRPRSPKPQEPR
jgi:hypothetical protein